MKKIISFSIVGLVASSAYAMPMQTAMEKVLQSNPDILVAKETMIQSKETLTQSRSAFMPTITATASTANNETKIEDATTSKNHPKAYSLTASQQLFNGFQNVTSYKSARVGISSAEASYDAQVQTTLQSLVQAYVDVLRDDEVVSLNTNQLAVLTKQLEATQRRYELGELTKTDVKQAEARLAEAEANLLVADAQLTTSRETLRTVLGEVPEQMTWPKVDVDIPNSVKELQEEVLANHPDIVKAVSDLSASKYNVNTAKGKHLPTITATASVTRNEDVTGSNGNVDTDVTALGLNLSLPIFSGGSTMSGVRTAVSLKGQAEQRYEIAQRNVRKELVDAWHNVKSTSSAYEAYKKAQTAVKLATEGVTKEERLGERDLLDVLNAQQDELNANVNVVRGKRDVIVAHYRWLAALGLLTEAK